MAKRTKDKDLLKTEIFNHRDPTQWSFKAILDPNPAKTYKLLQSGLAWKKTQSQKLVQKKEKNSHLKVCVKKI